MPKLSVKAVILAQNKELEDYATISIRVSYMGLSRYKETDYRVRVKDWDSKAQHISKSFPNHQLANASIKKEKATIERDLMFLKESSSSFNILKIEKYLEQGTHHHRKSFSRFVKEYAASQQDKNKKAEGTVGNYYKHLNKVHEYAGKDSLSFAEIDKEFLEGYEKWLVTKKKRPNSPNTVWDSVTKFFTKFFIEAKLPVPEYDWPQPASTSKEYLVMSEVDAVENILDDLSGAEYVDAIYFLLECYSGIRHSDWTRFKVEKLIHGDSLKVRAKKNGEPIYLSLKNRPRLKAILERIKEAPYTYTLESTNRNLKIIGAKAGIKKKISTHVGRHTCGTMHAELGFSKEYVAEMLGIGLKTVEYYYVVTRQKLRREDERLQGL